MSKQDARVRLAREKLARAGAAGLDADELLRRSVDVLRDVVPHAAGGWCRTDPATMLPIGGVMDGMPLETAGPVYENELLDRDVLKVADLALSRRPAGTLAAATSGELERSPRWRRIFRPHGFGDELRFALLADGVCYGNGCIVRRAGEPDFTPADVALVERLAGEMAQGLRAALGRANAFALGHGDSGVLVVDDDLRIVSATAAARAWVEDIGHGLGDELPPIPVEAVVRRTRAVVDGRRPDGPRRARLRTRSGRWLAVHASVLTETPRTWAVVLEPARPSEVLPLVAQAHELTPREQEVFGLLLRGVPDKLIARGLAVSDHTAREHTRRVLQKFGVRTRTELQALMHETRPQPAVAVTER